MTAYWLFALSVLILIGATDQLIKLTTRLAVSLRLSPLIIGLTVVSLGTSTPELVVSVMAAYRGDYGLSVGNIIGSNTVNVFLVLALALIASQVRVGTTKTQRNNLLLLIISAVYLLSFYLHLPTYLVALGSIGLGVAFMILEYHWGVEGRHL